MIKEIEKLKKAFRVLFATVYIVMLSSLFFSTSKEIYENIFQYTWFIFIVFTGIILFKSKKLFIAEYEYIYAYFPDLYKRLFGIGKPKGLAGTTTFKIVWFENRYIRSTKDQKLIDILNIHRWLLIGCSITFVTYIALIIWGSILFSITA